MTSNIQCELPNNHIYKFQGNLEVKNMGKADKDDASKGSDKISLS